MHGVEHSVCQMPIWSHIHVDKEMDITNGQSVFANVDITWKTDNLIDNEMAARNLISAIQGTVLPKECKFIDSIYGSQKTRQSPTKS